MNATTLEQGKPSYVGFRLTKDNGDALFPSDLREVHTQKIHLLIVDPSLEDYQHEHPEPYLSPGMYGFAFTPQTSHDYRVWVDITPVGGSQQFAMLDLQGTENCTTPCIEKKMNNEVVVDGYRFALKLPPLRVGEAAMGTVTVADKDGKPVTALEPVLGAFAHIVGFYDDNVTVAHMHPMGAEPKDANDRGGPVLTFHAEPSRAGYLKLFAQVKIDGKTIFAPFGVEVQ
jgi:hypothetical protein